MKVLNYLVWSVCLTLGACSMQPNASVQSNDNGAQRQWNKGILVAATPERPVGQESVSGLALPEMEVVRVGFVGLGMRGSVAVERFTNIPGTQIVALCDYELSRAEICQRYLKQASLPKAAVYSGEKGYEDLCRRDDIDLVYIATDWIHHFLFAKCALENNKNVAVAVPSTMTLKECWDLVNISRKAHKHCVILENYCYDWLGMNTLSTSADKCKVSCYAIEAKAGSHEDVDFIMDSRLVYCLQNGLPLDMDVSDLADWYCLAQLGELSRDNNSAGLAFPDFTRDGWNKVKAYNRTYATPEKEVATLERAKAFTAKLKGQGAKEWSVE